MRKLSFIVCMLVLGLNASAQQGNVAVETGPFTADWQSLDAWECPEWFKDAKFGIWAHWGPQCHAEDGDWYARFMYYDGSGQNRWHWDHFGDPAEFGLKELCNDWKAQNWNPESLVNLYKSVGARYFMALGNHHDNFDLWNSPYQEWNSVNVGPKKDIIKGWSDACKKAGLPLGVSIHASHAWTWLEPSQAYDGNLTKADGVGKWWEGLDPQELYAQNHEHSRGWMDSGSIHSQWDWGNGASLPSEAYKQKFQNRVLELINDYAPDMIYFDDTAMPFYGCDDEIGKNILAHYYNKANEANSEVVVTGKQLNTAQKEHMLWDVERGVPDRIQEKYWQTCTCIGSWHYDVNVYNRGGYKSAQQVVCMLVDIVSKNGNLLLSVPVKSDGTIDDKEQKILADIKAWMDINSMSIYGTRPWKTFGEGPLADAANPLSAQGFNEGNNYSSKDVRYVQRNDTLFATIMRWPSGKSFTFQSLGKSSEYYSGKVKSLQLLGYGDVEYSEGIDGVTVTLPSTHPNDIAPVFQITFEPGTDTPATLLEVIEGYEARLAELTPQASNNTGKMNKKGLDAFAQAIAEARTHLNDSEANQKIILASLNEAYQKLLSEGRNQPGAPMDGYEADITTTGLIEASNFTASEMGKRFGTPENWTVENYAIKMTNGDTKNGIDSYPGHNTLMLGRWLSEEVQPIESDITNARIYRTVHLEPGTYYFGVLYETHYNISESNYIFAANTTLSTQAVEENSIAFAHNNATGEGKWFGITFFIDKAQDVVLGWQADLTEGSTEQEFRVKEVKLLSYGMVSNDALFNLIQRAWETIESVKINNNTGYYRKDAANALQAAIETAEEKVDGTEEEVEAAYDALQNALEDFLKNGKNIGGSPIGSNYEDITIQTFQESENFARTPETQDGGRFGETLYWTVENFGFDHQAGIDNNPGYDCLHLEVWWNSNAFPEHGYDIANARLYQKAELPAGRYYLGAAYSPFEPNDESWIFVSDRILNSSEMTSQSIAYEQVSLAPRDGTFRGINFTLDEPTTVYMGFQADFSNSQTNNVRVKAVKLLYYGEITYSKLSSLIASVEEQMAAVKVNKNTGHYSEEAYNHLSEIVASAKGVAEDASYDAISDAYNTLSEAMADFLQNGRNPGGEPEKLSAVDITEEKLHEASGFSREDPSVATRFAKPAYWTVENFSIPNGGDGTKQGLDKYPGYDCLMLGIWGDRGNSQEGDLHNARIYQKVHLEAGRYYFGNTFQTRYNLSQAYLFAASEPLPTDEIESQSIAWLNIANGGESSTFNGIFFTLSEPQDVCLGFQANLAEGAGEQEFRADQVVLYGYNIEPSIIELNKTDDTDAPIEIYSLQGIRLQQVPQHGVFIVKKGNKTVKVMK
ncbi:MAG: alpha-L-fucosidase [Bacteroidaceae bacterium]|nr:alpha-L-fucosidase [Bacteroidaceae bacterium]